MDSVKIERIYGKPVMGRGKKPTQVSRVRFGAFMVGLIHDRCPDEGKVTFTVTNLTDEEKDHILREVSAIMGVEAKGVVSPGIPAKDQSENMDYGDF